MDPTKLLEADHRRVEELVDRIHKAEGSARSPKALSARMTS